MGTGSTTRREDETPHLAPSPAGFFTRLAVTFLEISIIMLLGMAVQGWVAEPLSENSFAMAVLLTTALVRILGEATWGVSPGKWLAGIRVKFPEDRRWMRLPQAALRNIWMWMFPLSMFFGGFGSVMWVGALPVALSIVVGPDRRSLTDLLAGAFVIDPKAPRRVPDPVDHVSPRRAVAWLVDMLLAALIGRVLGIWLDWSWWALGLMVLGVLKVGVELLHQPTPGKFLTGLRVDYPSGLLPVRVVARNLWILPALLLTTVVDQPLVLVEGFIAMTFLYLPHQRSITDYLAQAAVSEVGR